jgi:hypothetical protein
MIVIYGTKFYGAVNSYGGQCQLTKFFHIYYVPLLPVDTLWVTRELDKGYHGHRVKMSGRSVLAGYARVWGPVAAVGAFLAGSVGGIVAAAGLIGLSAWSWSWRSLRNAREQRRSDFHQLAFGTRCDPLDMDDELAHSLQPRIAAHWAQVSEGNSPEDIARLGAASPAQAVLAYASLRLAARLAPGDSARKTSHEASERIIDAIKETPALDAGPYRSLGQPELPPTTGGDFPR